MKVFSKDSRGVEAWGPTASVAVKCAALGGVVDNTWILVNFAIGANEITDVRQCFNDVSFIYALGNNQAQCRMSMTFLVMIGTKKCKGQNNTAAIASGFRSYCLNRISKKTSPQSIAIGNFSGSGWLVGIEVGNVDASRGVCYATVSFLVRIASK